MDTSCFDYCLTEDEHREFEQNGFFVVENAIPPQLVKDLTTVVDRLDAQYRGTGTSPDQKAPGTIDPNRPPSGVSRSLRSAEFDGLCGEGRNFSGTARLV